MHQFIFGIKDFVKHPSIINFFEQAFSSQLYISITVKGYNFYNFQWSSSDEERAKVIQEGLMNPSADILEAMVETEAVRAGRIPYLFKNIFKTLVFLL